MKRNILRPADVFYFCAHTGTSRDTEPQAPSNFKVYVLPRTERDRIEEVSRTTPYVGATVNDPVGTGYKDFPKDFLAEIASLDEQTRHRMTY